MGKNQHKYLNFEERQNLGLDNISTGERQKIEELVLSDRLFKSHFVRWG